MNWSPRFCASLSVRLSRLAQVAADGNVATVTFDLGQAGQRLFQILAQARDIGPGPAEQRRRAAVILIEQGEQQVLRFDELLIAADGQTLGIGQRLLELGGEFVDTHHCPLVSRFDNR